LTRRLLGKPWFAVEVSVPSVRLGTEYGGYAVMLAQLRPDSIVYSFGLGEDVSFDLALIERTSCQVFGFDPTPRSIAWVKAQALPAGFHVRELGIAAHDGQASFAPPKNPAHISHSMVAPSATSAENGLSFEVRRLSTIMRELGHERVDLLKMDVEGAEYDVLEDLLQSQQRPRQILVEFHHGMHGIPVARTERALRALRSAGYRIFDAQPSGREFSLALV
jgi:FkbM family methyltransferase